MKVRNIICAAIAVATVSACSLMEGQEAFVSPSDYYSSIGECEAGVRGCYIPLRSIYTKDFMMAVESVTDLMSAPGCATHDALLMISPATPRFGNTMWRQGYIGVRNANMCVRGIEESGLDEAKTRPLIAEAKTLRAHYYYLLTSLFGDVPYYTDVITTEEDLERIEKLPRMSAHDTRATLIKELEDCVGDLPSGRAVDVAGQHVGSAFCYMLIAKMAMWNEEWDSALTALDSLEKFYGPLTEERYPIADNCFSARNTDEDIFEIQHYYEAGGLTVTASLAPYFMPLKSDNTTSVYDGVDIPELGAVSATYVGLKPNKYFYQNLMSKSSSDRRKDYILAWSYKGKQFASAGTRPWMGPKFWCWGMTQTYDDNNFPVFRYADAVLMKAEVLNALHDTDGAIRYVNYVKQRAGIDLLTGISSEEAMLEEIQRERGRELIGEWQRKFDLVRWGIWYRQTYNYTDYETVRTNILPCHAYYPIPDTQVGLSGGALDNNEYAKYTSEQ